MRLAAPSENCDHIKKDGSVPTRAVREKDEMGCVSSGLSFDAQLHRTKAIYLRAHTLAQKHGRVSKTMEMERTRPHTSNYY